MKVERLEHVISKLIGKVKNLGNPKPSVVVGYRGVNYALPVHENMTAAHPVGKDHYLTDPARRLAKPVAKMVGQALKAGVEFGDALYLGGLQIQRESQQEVPVDTGNLKGSAFTEREDK